MNHNISSLWGNNTVNLILLIAINKVDKTVFYTINEYILSLMDNPNIFMNMKNAKDLAEFKDIALLHA